MRNLFAAFLFSVELLYALPTGRHMGSELSTPSPHHHTGLPDVPDSDGSSTHSASSWSISDLHLLSPMQWDSPSYSDQHSPLQMAVTDHVQVSSNARSALVSDEHAAGHVSLHHSPPLHHLTGASVASESDGSSTQSASSWTHSDLHLVAQMLRNSSPSSSRHSPPQLRATDSAHVGHSAPIIVEPASKRLKKHHDAKSPPPHHHSDPPFGLEWTRPSTQKGPSQSPSGHSLGSHEHELASINAAQALERTDSVPPTRSPPTKLKPLKLPRLPLPVTVSALPHEVENALHAAQAHLVGHQQARHQSSILKTAMASVADGCTSRTQYLNCMRQKYGFNLVEKHHPTISRIIRDDMKAKGTFGLRTSSGSAQRIDPHTETAAQKGKWFAKYEGPKRDLWLTLPPTGRKEPPYKDEDVHEYQEGIKHLDVHQLISGEYIKQAHRQMEQAPHRWHKSVPRKAMDRDLRSKIIDEDMFAHFQKNYHDAVKRVSIVLDSELITLGRR